MWAGGKGTFSLRRKVNRCRLASPRHHYLLLKAAEAVDKLLGGAPRRCVQIDAVVQESKLNSELVVQLIR